jgi:hypothetical protein
MGWLYAVQLAPGLSLLTPDGTLVNVIQIRLDHTPTTVYNLAVDGTHTYFADDVWVHNDSCRLQLIRSHGGDAHTLYGLHRAIELQMQYGDTVRWHEALRDNSGKIVSRLLPDIQYVENGKVHIIEIMDTHAPSAMRHGEMAKALGPSFGSYRIECVPLE